MEASYLLSALLLAIGGALGASLMWLLMKSHTATALAETARHHDIARVTLEQGNAALGVENGRQAERLLHLDSVVEGLRSSLESTRVELSQISERAARLRDLETAHETLRAERTEQASRIAELTTTLEAERRQSDEKLALLMGAKEQLSDQFKALANDILEENSKRFSAQNQATLGQLLDPVKTKLQEFQGKVEEVYVQEGKDRVALLENVKQLAALNQQLSEDAHRLTRALKGDAKARGNWGEVILERMLEAAGLRKGHEYDTQVSQRQEDGTRSILDIVVYLPEERHLVIDSKVSLIAYEEYVNAETEPDRESALKRHGESVRGHIKGLSVKNYEGVFSQSSPDFVVMFVPIEPAFLAAIAQDHGLWQAAWEKSVLIVSPSSLLFVLRSVAFLWRQDQQSRNYQEIAERGGKLYDRLVGFVAELSQVGERITQARNTYDAAIRTLSVENGNVIRQAELLKALGVKPKKSLPAALIEQSRTFDGEDALTAAVARSDIAVPSVVLPTKAVRDDEVEPGNGSATVRNG